MSAGYDAHERDPLASMRMTSAGYGDLIVLLSEVASKHGALALVTEGGYELTALAECLEASFAAVDGAHRPARQRAGTSAPRGERAVNAARAALSPFWRF